MGLRSLPTEHDWQRALPNYHWSFGCCSPNPQSISSHRAFWHLHASGPILRVFWLYRSNNVAFRPISERLLPLVPHQLDYGPCLHCSCDILVPWQTRGSIWGRDQSDKAESLYDILSVLWFHSSFYSDSRRSNCCFCTYHQQANGTVQPAYVSINSLANSRSSILEPTFSSPVFPFKLQVCLHSRCALSNFCGGCIRTKIYATPSLRSLLAARDSNGLFDVRSKPFFSYAH